MSTPPDGFNEYPEDQLKAEALEGDAPTPSEPAPSVASPLERSLEDMTLADLAGQFMRAPAATWDAFLSLVQTPTKTQQDKTEFLVPNRPKATKSPAFVKSEKLAVTLSSEELAVRQRIAAQLGGRIGAFLLALYGSAILASERTEETGLNVGAPFLVAAFILWIVAEIYGSWPALTEWRRNRSPSSPSIETIETNPDVASPEMTIAQTTNWINRLVFVAGAVAFTILNGAFSINNRFRLEGVMAWVISVVLWTIAFAPPEWGFRSLWASIRQVRFPRNWVFWTLLLIMLVAAYFRLNDLRGVPVEMTSDHVEKLLDSQSILNGMPQIFFSNNGGREPIQFYLMAFISHIPGLGMNFFTLKLLTVIEGLISIPVLWWMGKEMIGKDEPELGNLVGLLLAALVSVSYWHVMLSRLGLRIVLTVIFTGLLVIFLSRALRQNRRGDFLKAGLVLGIGLYGYQAVRMLPVVVIAGVAIAIVFGWFKRRGLRDTGTYLFNMVVLIVIALSVFVPMLMFSLQYPDDFWRRTSGRLLGDDTIQTTNEQGELVMRVATLDERMAAFRQNMPILLDNIRNALLMYNWKGDVAWISAAPNRPQMDMYTGSLLIIGLAAWAVRMVRRRDPADWLIPPMLFIMLLPSALSIAYPIENPSATRTSGSLPEAYLFAALPLALMIVSVKRLMPGMRGTLLAVGASVLIVLAAFGSNWSTYFGEYNDTYLASAPAPYSDAGRTLRGFAESGGSFGNAFMIAYPYWWDHRAVGIEAGLLDWPNGIVKLTDVPTFLLDSSLRTDRYRFDPNEDLMFFFSPQDLETENQLKLWFSSGYSQVITSYKPGGDFMIFRVPRLGMTGFTDFLQENRATH